MARIVGVDLPKNKPVGIALTYIYGIGRSNALRICEESKVDPQKRVSDLNDDEVKSIRTNIQQNHKVEGSLKAEVNMNIKRLVDINCYRGIRHKVGLPVNGQRTRTNARNRKGRKRRMVGKKRT